jgi:hypothetical protein
MRAYVSGRAQRTALYRHQAIADDPLCIVAFQLGAEPYRPAAIAFGTQTSGYELFVPGYPLNRDLLFAELLRFAGGFLAAFEAPAQGPLETVLHHGLEWEVPTALPQIVVANEETIKLLGRMGRYLAYLSTAGPIAADPSLPRLGVILQWLAKYAQMPGQQVILPLAQMLAHHYMTTMSGYESRSLPALEAWIDPPAGQTGFETAEVAERMAVGPVPDPHDGQRVHDLMAWFNEARRGSTDPAVVRRLVWPLRVFYGRLINPVWELIWRVVDRERLIHEAPSVGERVQADRLAYAQQMHWMATDQNGGRLRTRTNTRGAALHLSRLEQRNATLQAQEAIDDPVRMIPARLRGRAVAGAVVAVNDQRRELSTSGRRLQRPSVVLRSQEPCLVPVGTKLWWTDHPADREWVVTAVTPHGSGSQVTLVLQTSTIPEGGLPLVGNDATFSIFNFKNDYVLHLPQQAPWTHRHTPDPLPDPNQPLAA